MGVVPPGDTGPSVPATYPDLPGGMHAGSCPGYDIDMGDVDPSHPRRGRTALSRDGLLALLRAQHEELRVALERLPRLRGAARADVFLQVRRRLAVHEALEARLVVPRIAGRRAPDPVDLRGEVFAAEEQGPDHPAFGETVARVLSAHRRHSEVQERSTFPMLPGGLTRAERAVAGTAVLLWLGEGDAYPGNRYQDMVETAREQLADVAPGELRRSV